MAKTRWVRWCPTYLGNSKQPYHFDSHQKINKRDI